MKTLKKSRCALIAISLILFMTSCNNSKPKIDEFETNWTGLTKQKSQWVIYNSCDMGNREILLTDSILLMHGTQEDDTFIVQNTEIVNESILVRTKNSLSKASQDFKFSWINKTKGVIEIYTQYPGSSEWTGRFVSRTKSNKIKVVDQPCRECWPELECDFLDSLKKSNS